MNVLNRRIRLIVGIEIRHFFLHRRSKHLIPLIILGVILAMWRYWASPFVVLSLVVFAGLEPQFNNMLFRTPHELESLSLLPISWRDVVIGKNIAAIVLLSIVVGITGAVVLYFAPTPPAIVQYRTAAMYFLVVTLPIVHLGNRRSVIHPRRVAGWQYQDVVGLVEMLIHLVVVSLPFLVFVEVLSLPALCVVYFIGTVFFWWLRSVPHTVRLIEEHKATICLAR